MRVEGSGLRGLRVEGSGLRVPCLSAHSRQAPNRAASPSLAVPCWLCWGGEACLLIRKHDHFTPTREIKRHVRALAPSRAASAVPPPAAQRPPFHVGSVQHSSQFKKNHSTEMCSGSEAGSYLRLIYSCITRLKARGPSRTGTESKEEVGSVSQAAHLHVTRGCGKQAIGARAAKTAG